MYQMMLGDENIQIFMGYSEIVVFIEYIHLY